MRHNLYPIRADQGRQLQADYWDLFRQLRCDIRHELFECAELGPGYEEFKADRHARIYGRLDEIRLIRLSTPAARY